MILGFGIKFTRRQETQQDSSLCHLCAPQSRQPRLTYWSMRIPRLVQHVTGAWKMPRPVIPRRDQPRPRHPSISMR
ncbi:uncharacterized protein CTRU02_213525 [Colletotrichum truncatum]|uniref:Uncharacterized protein n=1 Tax=Colletotrichum truncatum TaxID=5467 RepID=A0ACC3YG03_COLTU